MVRSLLVALAGIVLLEVPAFAGGSPTPPICVPSATRLAPDDANMAKKKALDLRYEVLLARFKAWETRAKAFNKAYSGRKFDEGSKEAKDGAAEQAWLVQETREYTIAAKTFATDVGQLRISRVRGERGPRIDQMNAMARRLEWDKQALDRLDKALNGLDLDGDGDRLLSAISDAWLAIESRAQDPELARKASKGDGPGIPDAGTQSFNDCTIFALANASGEPYGVVAARATTLLEGAEWRPAEVRAHPQEVIERHGLNGDEVTLLAESLGQAEVVRSGEFARTLKEGRPILACIIVLDEKGDDYLHQVVLTRSFQHDGGTWYEMQDSNLGTGERRYLSERELQVLLFENGVAYRRDPGRTPKLLRPKDSK